MQKTDPMQRLSCPASEIDSLLEDDLQLERMIKKVYETKVVFKDFLQELSSEIGRTLGIDDPSVSSEVSSKILNHPFREKFFAKLAKVAQG